MEIRGPALNTVHAAFISTKRRSRCSLAPGIACKSRNVPFCSFFPETASVEDVIKYLDPQYIDRMAIPDAMKLQFILAGT